MNKTTVSEDLFERFCQENGIRFCRVPRTNVQTPDYDMFLKDQKIVTEVKQFDPNADDVRLRTQLEERGWTDAFGGEPGHRVRKKISDAVPQLRRRSAAKYPALLVLYNNVGFTSYTDPYSIKTGMYGLEVIALGVAGEASTAAAVVDRKFGPKQKVSPRHNTTLSALAVLSHTEGSSLSIDFFHNIFARIELDPAWVRLDCARHFSLQEKVRLKFQEWVRI